MNKILYFDCFSGLSGDMTVAALLDLGLDGEKLKQELLKLHLSGYDIEISQESRRSIRGTVFRVNVHNHEPHHRHLPEIEDLINASELEPPVKANSINTFRLLGAAEARVHNVPIEQIHFHEVGALDAIIDIVSAAICMSWLNPGEVMVAGVNTGSGFVECAHGRLPVPAPATLELLNGFAVYSSGEPGELTTPTGAAILKTYAKPVSSLPLIEIQRCGYGCGQRDCEQPNLLRIIEGFAGVGADSGACWMIETNIDDMNPECYSHLFPLLLENGALDVFVTPVFMKKNRPGLVLSVLCRPERRAELEELVLQQTSTFGLRKYEVQREELEREIRMIETRYGPVPLKCGMYNGETIKYSPEFETCQSLAIRYGLPLPRIYQDITADAGQVLGKFSPLEDNLVRRRRNHDG